MKGHSAQPYAAAETLGTYRVGIYPASSDTLLTVSIYSQAKVALKANSEDELLELEAIAKSLNLCARSILDA